MMSDKSPPQYRSLLWLLVAYVLAMLLPAPGNWLRATPLVPGDLLDGVRAQHLLLALMLVCAGLLNTPEGLRSTFAQRHSIAVVTLLSWILPGAAAICAALILGLFPAVPVEVRLAVLIIAAMPIANSTAGWASYVGANISLSLAVLMLATLLSPLITAPLINFGIIVTGLQRDGVHTLPAWGNDMSTFFALWVLLPIMVGVALSQWLSRDWLSRWRPWAKRTSLATLLILNYINGTVCLPNLIHQPRQFWLPLLAAVLLMSGVLVLLVIYRLTSQRRQSPLDQPADLAPTQLLGVGATTDRTPQLPTEVGDSTTDASVAQSLRLAVIMRNTGAAMVYTSTALAEVPLVSLVIVVYTLLQHVVVSGISTVSRRIFFKA